MGDYRVEAWEQTAGVKDFTEIQVTDSGVNEADSIVRVNSNMDFDGFIRCQGLSFTEAALGAAGTYTGTVEIPAGAFLVDIVVVNVALWDDTTAASMIIGDDDDPNGWIDATDMKATALVVGEAISVMDSALWGGEEGAYVVAATGRRGRVTSGVDSGPYYGAASEVIVKISVTDGDGTAGRTKVLVTYAVPTLTAVTGVVT